MTDAEARLVWLALFESNVNLLPENWIFWADKRIVEHSDTPQWWVCSLANAKNREEALLAISEDIGLDLPENTELSLQELVIGFVVNEHLESGVSYEQMWASLWSVTDIAQYLDSGAWRKHSGKNADCISGCSPGDILRRLSPLGAIAASKRRQLNA